MVAHAQGYADVFPGYKGPRSNRAPGRHGTRLAFIKVEAGAVGHTPSSPDDPQAAEILQDFRNVPQHPRHKILSIGCGRVTHVK